MQVLECAVEHLDFVVLQAQLTVQESRPGVCGDILKMTVFDDYVRIECKQERLLLLLIVVQNNTDAGHCQV